MIPPQRLCIQCYCTFNDFYINKYVKDVAYEGLITASNYL